MNTRGDMISGRSGFCGIIDDKSYSWGEFYETTKTCDEYSGEQREKFRVFEELDNASSEIDIYKIINSLTEEQINWLNSPCLDGLIYMSKCSNMYKEVGNNINKRTKFIENPIQRLLSHDIVHQYEETCKYLLEKNLGKRCLLEACRYGKEKIVNLFLKHGANIHFRENQALYMAGLSTRSYIVTKLLLENGANIHTTGGRFAFELACSNGTYEIVSLFIESGMKINEWSLVQSCASGKLDIVELLLNRIENKINTGRALAVCCSYGYFSLVKLLLEKGADIHWENDSPFCFVCENAYIDIPKYLEIAQYLLDKGANIRAYIEYASHNLKLAELTEFLLKNGAKI